MTELERAAAFEELIRDRCAERVVQTRFGPALFNDTFARIWYLNVVRAERAGDAAAEEIAHEIDRVQAELLHRRVILPLGADKLQAGFRDLGWEPDHFLFMAYRGGGEPADTSHVRDVEPEQLHRLREEIVREWQPGADPATVGEIIAADELMWRAANSRIFGVVEDGEVVSSAQLYSDGGTAQVEEVATHPSHRGRGHAKAVVTKAVEEAIAADHEFIFLVADGENWPKKLYERLGFEELGSRFAFLRR